MENENEIVIRQHWSATIWYRIWAVLGWTVWLASVFYTIHRVEVEGYYFDEGLRNAIAWSGYFSILMTWLVIHHHSICYKIGPHCIEAKTGFWALATTTIPYTKIRMVVSSQSILERWLGVGDVGIDSAGSGGADIKLESVREPEKVKELIEARL